MIGREARDGPSSLHTTHFGHVTFTFDDLSSCGLGILIKWIWGFFFSFFSFLLFRMMRFTYLMEICEKVPKSLWFFWGGNF
jgi:hypothetical protein